MTENAERPRHLRVEVPVSSSLCSPAVRTVVAMVYYEEKTGEIWRETTPVVAVEARISDVYGKDSYNPREMPRYESSSEILLDKGYTYYSRIIELNVVTADLDSGLISSADGNPASNGFSQVVACSWPPEKDDEKLGPIFEEMEKSAKNRMKK